MNSPGGGPGPEPADAVEGGGDKKKKKRSAKEKAGLGGDETVLELTGKEEDTMGEEEVQGGDEDEVGPVEVRGEEEEEGLGGPVEARGVHPDVELKDVGFQSNFPKKGEEVEVEASEDGVQVPEDDVDGNGDP